MINRVVKLVGATPGNRAFLDRAQAAATRSLPIVYHGFMYRIIRIDKDRTIPDTISIELEEMN